MKILILMLFFISACKTPTTENFNALDSYLDLDLSESKTLGALNTEYMDIVDLHRRSQGLRSFLEEDDITAEAQKHAENMAQGLVPFGTSGSLERCTRIKAVMGQGATCGEILAKGPDTSEEVFTLWMKGISSRARIESTKFTHSGLGLAKSSDGTEYWVQIFVQVP